MIGAEKHDFDFSDKNYEIYQYRIPFVDMLRFKQIMFYFLYFLGRDAIEVLLLEYR